MKEYTFLTSLYKNSVLEEMQLCVASMEGQTVPPSQIVIVIDGAIPSSLNEYVDGLQQENRELYTVVQLEQNVGLGNALKEGTHYCKYEMIARTDTDDICDLTRMEKQLQCFENDAELSIVGSNIAEFVGTIDNIVSFRNVPEQHDEICEYLKKRCPFNHMTVTMKKRALLDSGGYMDWHYNEDSYLWARMYLNGCKFLNLSENLVYARINEDTFKRRGGYKYYKSEKELFKFMYKHNIIGFWQYLKAKCVRFVVQVLMPNSVRKWFFKKFARG